MFFLAAVGVMLMYLGARDFSHDIGPGTVVLGGLLLFPLPIFLVLKWRDAAVSSTLASHASTTQGRITHLKKSLLTGAYVLRYRFQDFQGREHQGKRMLDQPDAFKWRVGDTGSVRFSALDPAKHVWVGRDVDSQDDIRAFVADMSRAVTGTPVSIAPEERPSTFTLMQRSWHMKRAALHGIYVLLMALFWVLYALLTEDSPADVTGAYMIFGFAVAFFPFWLLWNARKGARAVQDWGHVSRVGTATQGTVTLVEEKREAWGRWTWIPGWVISYRYADASGRSRAGVSGYLSRREAANWRTGDPCLVLFDPLRPEQSVWIGGPRP